MTYHAKVSVGGEIVIPVELLQAVGIADGDSVVLSIADDGSISVRTYGQVVKDVQRTFLAKLPPGYEGDIVDEFISERRAEAVLEKADYDRWLQAHDLR